MAGLRGLMILLVLMVGSARCQDNSTESKSDPKCSYSVEQIKFGLQIKMTDFTPNNFTVYVAEIGDSFERRDNFNSTSKNSTYDIKPLKPCTEYELKVTFSGFNGTEIICNTTKNKTTTGMTEQEIKNTSCPPGYFCYQSDWNITSSQSENNKVSFEDFNNGSYRFKQVYDDMCSDLVLTFPPKNCSNATFTISETFTVDFIDPIGINQTKPDKLPAEIKPELPSSCKNLNLSVEYKCSGNNNTSIEPSNMKPFTNYSCTGDIKMNNVSINKTLLPVQFNIDCDFTVTNLKTSSTNTSIELNWETRSEKCQDVLDKLDELYYHCKCEQKGDGRYEDIQLNMMIHRAERRMCSFKKGVKPFRDYRCNVHHSYTGQQPFGEKTITGKTEIGNNSKALIGCLVFLIIFIILGVAFFIRKRIKSRNDNEEQKLFSTVIYANMPPPKRQPMKI